MKRLCIIAVLLVTALAIAHAKGDKTYEYEYLYKGLPFKMKKVEAPTFPTKTVSLTSYNIKGDGKTKCTSQFQKAIDELSKKGGGTLEVPVGVWFTGPIVLKDNVNLHLNKGAIILFSPDFDDYPMVHTTYEGLESYRSQSPISANGATNIAITGAGIIDGNGQAWRQIKKEKISENEWKRLTSKGGFFPRPTKWQPREQELPRPVMVNLFNCKNVFLQGVIFQNSPAWNLHPELCDGLIIDGVDVRNPSYAQNGDGLDLESCKNCIIRNTTFDVGDDGICIKSGKEPDGLKRNIPTENVIIDGCTVYAGHGGFVIGSEMSGGVKNMKCSNCQFVGTDNGLRFKSRRGRGGVVENIWIENISMVKMLGDAIRFNLYYGGKSVMEEMEDGTKRPAKIEAEPVSISTPSFRDIYIKNLVCKDANRALYFNGLPEMPVKNIFMENVSITAKDAGYMTYSENVQMKNVVIEAEDGKQPAEYYCTKIIKK